MNAFKELSYQDECNILGFLDTYRDLLDGGSSRLVFESNHIITSYLLDNFFTDEKDKEYSFIKSGNYVVKVAIGSAGIVQNDMEQDVYNEVFGRREHMKGYPDNLPDFPSLFAPIFAAGKFVEIMAKVDPFMDDFRSDFYDDVMEVSDGDELIAIMYGDENGEVDEEDLPYDRSVFFDVVETIQAISDELGYTSDCAQIGFIEGLDGLYAYDYGFNEDSNCSESCSRYAYSANSPAGADIIIYYLQKYCRRVVESSSEDEKESWMKKCNNEINYGLNRFSEYHLTINDLLNEEYEMNYEEPDYAEAEVICNLDVDDEDESQN